MLAEGQKNRKPDIAKKLGTARAPISSDKRFWINWAVPIAEEASMSLGFR
jgi:hypothetical protein